MSSVLINIGRSGALVARQSLELTAQNIANAGNEDYVRRRLGQAEAVGVAINEFASTSTLAGVRTLGIERNNSTFLQVQARESAGDLARIDAELAGLRRAENALESSGIYDAIVGFEASLAQLQSDPLDASLRTGVIESARILANTFGLATDGLGTARELSQYEVETGVASVNRIAEGLAGINAAIARAQPGSAAQAGLFDQRDAALAELAGQIGISAEYRANGAVDVRLGDTAGPLLVNGTSPAALSSTFAGDGTVSFDIGGAAVTPGGGALAGGASALAAQRDLQAQLDDIAALTIGTANNAQANGAARDGSPGQPLFSGGSAATIALALSTGDGIATAPVGSSANSRDISNLVSLSEALADNGPAARSDAMLFGLSTRIDGQDTTRIAFAAVAEGDAAALIAETGIDLDAEAANLVRFQQAFQASSRVIEVANTLFDTILGIR